MSVLVGPKLPIFGPIPHTAFLEIMEYRSAVRVLDDRQDRNSIPVRIFAVRTRRNTMNGRKGKSQPK